MVTESWGRSSKLMVVQTTLSLFGDSLVVPAALVQLETPTANPVPIIFCPTSSSPTNIDAPPC